MCGGGKGGLGWGRGASVTRFGFVKETVCSSMQICRP